jgi:hypothetical protein
MPIPITVADLPKMPIPFTGCQFANDADSHHRLPIQVKPRSPFPVCFSSHLSPEPGGCGIAVGDRNPAGDLSSHESRVVYHPVHSSDTVTAQIALT